LPIWHQCGVLWMAPDGHGYAADTLATLRRPAYAVEVLDRRLAGSRYPHFALDTDGLLMLEPDGGVIMARRSVQALAAELSRKGVRIQHGRVETPSTRGRLEKLQLADGTALAAGQFVFACGPWLPKVLPQLLGERIFPTRQVVMYFGLPAGDQRFGAAHTPAWIDLGAGIYGIPDLESRGLKVGLDTRGLPFDPDTDERVVDRGSIDEARAWVTRRLPALADAPLIESRVCQYENTVSGDFVIDRHPEHDNVWIAGGGSGHGFKHGPAVGEYLAHLMATGEGPEARFAIDGPAAAQRVIF
jgi:glycine/D-amino acid oxidase-like deaminating enzyme